MRPSELTDFFQPEDSDSPKKRINAKNNDSLKVGASSKTANLANTGNSFYHSHLVNHILLAKGL